jgi:hypothetical protein
MEIVKITRWYLDSGRRNPMLRKGQFVYGVYDKLGQNFDVLLTPRGQRFAKRVRQQPDVGANTSSWALIAGEDEWEHIPETEWPDEVCVEVARMALVGDQDA